MPLSDIVNVTVTTQNPGVTRAGFGVPLILSQTAAWVERQRVYTTIEGVLADFAATTPEYNAAVGIFSQSPRPTKLRIGRASTNPITQRWAVAVAAVAAASVYKLYDSDATGAKQTVSYTALASIAWAHSAAARVPGDLISNDTGKLYICITGGVDGNAGGPTGTNADIVDGAAHWMYAGAGGVGVASNDAILYNLMLGLNALVAPPATTNSLQGVAGSKTLRVLANTTAVWVGIEIDDPNLLALTQDHAAPTGGGLATDLSAIQNENNDWYGLITLYNSSAYVAAAAAWAETQQKIYVPATNDTASATTADVGATDVLHNLKAASYARSAGFFHPRAFDFADASEMGRFFPIAPGGDNWRLKTLSGVTAGWGNGQQYTATQIQNLKDRRANFYYILAGVSLIGGDGKVAANEYIDVVRGRDWWVARVGERLANLLIQNEKIPYTDDGIGLVEAEVRAQNDEGIEAKLINPGSPPGIPAPTVSVPKSGAVSTADRQARTLNNVNTSWVLAGAINFLQVNATITA